MNQAIAIVTGNSRGMGEALATQLLASGHRVLGIARHAQPGWSGPDGEQWLADLADAAPLVARLEEWLHQKASSTWSSVTLINNAAALGAPGPLDAVTVDDLQRVLRVGLEAPMLLTSAFLRATADWSCPRRVLNISSGLARRAMSGTATYCAAKAGMDHFSRAVALEQAGLPNPAKIVSLAPGVIETGMQAALRGADPSAFPERERFQQLHDGGALSSAEAAARQVLHFLERPDFGSQVIADVRDA